MVERTTGRPEAGTSYGHHLVDGEWVEITVDEHGQFVTPDGETIDPLELTDFGRYSVSAIIEGEVVHGYESTVLSGEHSQARASGAEFVDADREAVDMSGELTVVPDYQFSVVVDGEVEHRYGRNGVQTLDDNGNAVIAGSRPEPYDIDFESHAVYQGRKAVIGVDGAGERVLLTPDGQPIDDGVDWSQVRRVDAGPLLGEAIAIGDYALDPTSEDTTRVYLFPDGSQAVSDDAGGFERVIVPTESDYPDGRPVFEGAFIAREPDGEFGTSDTHAVVFSYADGQAATSVDGEMMLVDMAVDVDYPDGPPIACGQFPGGELFVFPDGRQILRANDGSWGIGTLPDLPPYDELAEQFGAPDVDAVPDVDLPAWERSDDLLLDDITGVGVLDLPTPGEQGATESNAPDTDPPPAPDAPDGQADIGIEASALEGVENGGPTDPFEFDPASAIDPFSHEPIDPTIDDIDEIADLDDGALDDG